MKELVSGKCFSDNTKKKAIQKKLFSVLFKLSASSVENIREMLQAVGIAKDCLKWISVAKKHSISKKLFLGIVTFTMCSRTSCQLKKIPVIIFTLFVLSIYYCEWMKPFSCQS